MFVSHATEDLQGVLTKLLFFGLDDGIQRQPRSIPGALLRELFFRYTFLLLGDRKSVV